MSRSLNGREIKRLRDSCIPIEDEEVVLGEGVLWNLKLSTKLLKEKREIIKDYLSQIPESDDPMKLCYDIDGNIWTADMNHVDAVMQLRSGLIRLDKEDFYVEEEQQEMPSSNR